MYDAILIVSFGGPEGMSDVMPFLDNVLRGRNVPEARKHEVAHHYEQFGGVSPINAQNRSLISCLRDELNTHGIDLPIYWGNRNWHPLLPDTMQAMADDGVKRALAFFTSAYSSYSGCRQYREDIARAHDAVGDAAPEVDKIRVYHNHPGFIAAVCDHVCDALATFATGTHADTHLVFTAHSLPSSMAQTCAYEAQLRDACEIVASELEHQHWDLVYQSRSGPPSQPWLGPDVCDHLRTLQAQGVTHVVLMPIGFISDHMEILFDLDTEARELCAEIGLEMALARTAGTHPAFIAMIRELIQERLATDPVRRAMGRHGPWHDVCPPNCCMPSARTC